MKKYSYSRKRVYKGRTIIVSAEPTREGSSFYFCIHIIDPLSEKVVSRHGIKHEELTGLQHSIKFAKARKLIDDFDKKKTTTKTQ